MGAILSVAAAALAVRDRLPASANTRELAAAGVLMTYGTDILDTYRQVGVYTGSILKGATPATFRCCSRPSSNSFSICRRRNLSALTFARRCWPVPTR